jgi:hypothetical protein
MATVTVPAGCTGLDFADGSKVSPSRQGGSVEVSDEHARAIKRGWYGETGTITTTGYSFGTKGTRRCTECGRAWNSWTTICHRCNSPTQLV